MEKVEGVCFWHAYDILAKRDCKTNDLNFSAKFGKIVVKHKDKGVVTINMNTSVCSWIENEKLDDIRFMLHNPNLLENIY
jgi:hypothetical protein